MDNPSYFDARFDEVVHLKSACKGKYWIAEVDRVRRRKRLRLGGEQVSQHSLLVCQRSETHHPSLVHEENTENTSERNGQSLEKTEGGHRMKRPTFEETRKKALKNTEIKKEYDSLGPEYDLIRQLLRMRLESGLTQEDMAKLLGTKKPNISRLESHAFQHSPRLRTVKRYAEVAGYEMMIKFKRVRPPAKKRTDSRTKKAQV
jgi:DNA-binding XRE family transcriptional regulator